MCPHCTPAPTLDLQEVTELWEGARMQRTMGIKTSPRARFFSLKSTLTSGENTLVRGKYPCPRALTTPVHYRLAA